MEGLIYAVVLVLAATAWVAFVALIMWITQRLPRVFKSLHDMIRRR